MWEIVIRVVFGLMVIGASFWIGYFMGIKDALDLVEEPDEEEKLHCFECETETPVKEVNGRFHCGNCGLVHSDYYC